MNELKKLTKLSRPIINYAREHLLIGGNIAFALLAGLAVAMQGCTQKQLDEVFGTSDETTTETTKDQGVSPSPKPGCDSQNPGDRRDYKRANGCDSNP